MDLEVYQSKYSNLTLEELQNIRDTSTTDSVFDFTAKSIHEDRERVKVKGKAALLPQPSLQILSVSFHPHDEYKNKSFAIYGKIHAEYLDCGTIIVHDLYDRDRSDAEIISSNSDLTLIGPNSVSTRPEYACIPLFRSRIKVMLYDGVDHVFAEQCLFLDDEFDVDNYEKSIRCEFGFLCFKYIPIHFGVNCRLEIKFASQKQEFGGDVIGRVVVRYGNKYESCSSSKECVLFDKQANESKSLGKSLQLSRYWVAVPAQSPFTIAVNLFNPETKQQIVNDSVEFIPQQGWMSTSFFVSGDIIIQVRAAWFSPKPMGRCTTTSDYHFLPSQPIGGVHPIKVKEKDAEMMDFKSSDDESDDSSDLNPPRTLRPHRVVPLSSPAIEIFSIYVGREKSKAIKLHGVIDVISDDHGICSIFKRNDNDALVLPDGVKSLSIPDGSRIVEDFNPLEMKVDIKDVEGHLAIKGYVDWSTSVLDSYLDMQLCSLIQGLNGYAAIYYSIFSEAVGAYMRVILEFKSENSGFYGLICGSVISEYSCYDYSSQYNKNYFRNILFRKSRDDPIRLGIDSSIPLSRSMFVVPSYSSLVVHVDLDFQVSNRGFSCAEKIEIEIGEVCKTIETNECFIRIELDWCEIK